MKNLLLFVLLLLLPSLSGADKMPLSSVKGGVDAKLQKKIDLAIAMAREYLTESSKPGSDLAVKNMPGRRLDALDPAQLERQAEEMEKVVKELELEGASGRRGARQGQGRRGDRGSDPVQSVRQQIDAYGKEAASLRKQAKALRSDAARKKAMPLPKSGSGKGDFDWKGKGIAKGLHDSNGNAEESMVGLALLQSGTPPSHPMMERIWSDLEEERPCDTTYALAVRLIFAEAMMHAPCGEAWPSKERKEKVMACVHRWSETLASGCHGGAWSYTCGRYGIGETSGKRYSVSGGEIPLPRDARIGSDVLKKVALAAKSHDYSNTQYAILGLKAASLCGVRPWNADEFWRLILEQFLTGQELDGERVVLKISSEGAGRAGVDLRAEGWEEVKTSGERSRNARARGWNYSNLNLTDRLDRRLRGNYGSATMSAAGLTALLVGRSEISNLQPEECLLVDAGIHDGLAWFQKNWPLSRDVPANTHQRGVNLSDCDGYLLYGLERLGVLGNLKTIGGNPWYEQGAAALLESQCADGFWQGNYGGRLETAFDLLFLCRGTRAAFSQPYEVGDWEPDKSGEK